MESSEKKNRMTAILLALFLGTLGVHKFYLGDSKMGLIYLLLACTGVSAILSIIDIVKFAQMTDEQFASKYSA